MKEFGIIADRTYGLYVTLRAGIYYRNLK